MATFQPHILLLSAALTVASASIAQGQPALDRVVGRDASDAPLIVTALDGRTIGALARATGVPMGLEGAPLAKLRPWTITATGKTLRAVLDAIVAADSRYEWRDMDGVIVFRPVKAWSDGQNPLFRLVKNVRIVDATMSEAVGVVRSLLRSTVEEKPSFPDTRRVSVDLPQGTVLDLLNALAIAHGEMSWHWEEPSAAERRLGGLMPEHRHAVTFSVFGGGNQGFSVP